MDERHYLSTPRPILEQEEPTWEVDVFRIGVDDPLLTLVINDKTLPPRCNKKKKIIWKLPDSAEQVPTFGSEDKRRIWELFKQQRKVRRKSSKLKTKQPTNDSQHSNTSDSQQDCSAAEMDATFAQEELTNPKPQSQEKANGGLSNGSHVATTTAMPLSNTPPATLQSPPPGFGSSQDTTTDTPASIPQAPTVPTPPQPPVAAPIRRTWKVAMTPEENVATALARMFIDTYYAMLHVGNSIDLYGYYCPGIQKSLSVGDAHHVCTTPQEVLLQLQSLAHPTWQLKGVVTQVGIMNSVVLLITGTVLLGNDATAMSFCHSVTLVQVLQDGGEPAAQDHVREYQIHNDAMAFLK